MTTTSYLRRVLTGTCCIALISAAPAFAGRRLSDKEMDKATAKGQPTLLKGEGKQTIYDHADHTVNGSGWSQEGAKGLSIANVAGENNVAVGQNLALTGGTLKQENKIRQDHAVRVTLAPKQGASKPHHGGGKPWDRPKGNDGKPHDGGGKPYDDGGKPQDAALKPVEEGQKPGDGGKFGGRPDGKDRGKRHYIASGDKIRGDHVKLGDGDQWIKDKTKFSVVLSGNSQQGAVAASLLNVAGRNNVAVGQNVGAGGFGGDSQGLSIGGGGSATLTQTNSIIQNH